MFETVKLMFSQDPAFWREASGNRFYNDFELDLGGVLGARSAHILLFEPLVSASFFFRF